MRTRVGLGVAVAAGIGIVLLAEIALRMAGMASVPLFERSGHVGYYVKSRQHGAFLNRNDWAFDEEGLGVARPFRQSADGILLIGDSIVYGGNPFPQGDKLGPSLQAATGRPVWPLAAGGWALLNEIEMLKAHPRLLALPTLIWVVNSGDFGESAPWTNDINYPTAAPWSALLFALRKTIFHPHDIVNSTRTAASEKALDDDLRWLAGHYHGRILWVLYPQRAELHRDPAPFFQPLTNRLPSDADLLPVARAPAWSGTLYRDAVIHPTAPGNRVLADIIARRLAPADRPGSTAAPLPSS